MPVRAVCPECGATTSLDDSAPAAPFVCHQCGGTVAVPAAKAGPPPLPKAGPPPLPARAAAPAADAGFEVLDEDGDSAVAVADPPTPGRPAARAARPPADDDEYEVLRDVGDDEPEPDEDDEDDGSAGVPRIKGFVGDFEPGTRPLPRRKGQSS